MSIGYLSSLIKPEKSQGKQRKRYHCKDMMTPYEKLKSLPSAKQYLKSDVTFDILDKVAGEMTDNQSAQQLQKQRRILFNQITEQDRKLAWFRLIC